jgi:hypothetical protein
MNMPAAKLADAALVLLRSQGLEKKGECKVILARGTLSGDADCNPAVAVMRLGAGGFSSKAISVSNSLYAAGGVPIQRPGTVSLRSTLTNLPLIMKPVNKYRCGSLGCSAAPPWLCWHGRLCAALLLLLQGS